MTNWGNTSNQWAGKGARGAKLEELVNMTNERYAQQNLALMQKIPTPITPVRFDRENRHITLAYFDQLSTVDYIGVVQGVPVCFDAKESALERLPLANVHEHQMKFMKQFEAQGGIAFFLIYFSKLDLFYYMPFVDMQRFWERGNTGGRKSIRLDELSERFFLTCQQQFFIPYLDCLAIDLEERQQPKKE